MDINMWLSGWSFYEYLSKKWKFMSCLKIIIAMKSFAILEVLVYNPTLKSEKKKPIESDIQEAKIVAYLPSNALI